MGVIDSAQRTAQDSGPECPPVFISTFEKYRELKFIRREDESGVKLYARDMLEWSDLVSYSQITGQNISMFESELIMGLDAIYEGKDDV